MAGVSALNEDGLHAARLATTCLMFVRGLLVGGWMAFVPSFKQSFRLDDGELGLAILSSGLATLLMTVPVGRVIDSFGPRPVAFTTGIVSPLMYAALPTLAHWRWQPYAPLFVMSMVRAGGGIAYTSRAAELERLWGGKPLMSSFHAAFSAGCFAGSASYAAMLSYGLSGGVAFPSLCVFTAVAAAVGVYLMDRGMPERQPVVHAAMLPIVSPCSWAPSPLIICLGMLGALVQLVQGGLGDWGALYLHKYDRLPFSSASLGYSFFACAMGVCRLFGDAWCHHFGRQRVYRAGGLLMMAGLSLLLLTSHQALALVSCAIVGVGSANLYPILMSCAGRHGLPSPGLAIATVSSLGITGLLAGPGIIGFVAQVSSLRAALSSLVVFSCFVTLASHLVNDDLSDENALLPSPDLDKFDISIFDPSSPIHCIDECTEYMALEGDASC
eukprot:Gregarina_sp_Pseudo_9__488@NODE_1310_length_1696_cov_38_228123_g1231_i0_p1_GENE_NODE_1310_length_1696_cov_38_228123_g1231_i0NODE_1310_length_1696_cov_38_228123_g1231_i0_p1_ORF_typecomplete_len442_score152_00MFS_1/PF07690_16/5_1e06MFS_1/PF07690_16/8_5e12MFS_2/PF13347_6/1_7e08MFS_3/PF05977_13/2_1e07MFS_4/PF06779_14/3_5MFS_4/PF06779_14/0_00053Sugar_tr/PF00083_24/3_5Sugar_tr/PF00083_24/5_7_NODE_1310_length_1696_cov_38_228123_g1231_i02531578